MPNRILSPRANPSRIRKAECRTKGFRQYKKKDIPIVAYENILTKGTPNLPAGYALLAKYSFTLSFAIISSLKL